MYAWFIITPMKFTVMTTSILPHFEWIVKQLQLSSLSSQFAIWKFNVFLLRSNYILNLKKVQWLLCFAKKKVNDLEKKDRTAVAISFSHAYVYFIIRPITRRVMTETGHYTLAPNPSTDSRIASASDRRNLIYFRLADLPGDFRSFLSHITL